MIKDSKERGVTVFGIAQKLGLNRATVRRKLKKIVDMEHKGYVIEISNKQQYDTKRYIWFRYLTPYFIDKSNSPFREYSKKQFFKKTGNMTDAEFFKLLEKGKRTYKTVSRQYKDFIP